MKKCVLLCFLLALLLGSTGAGYALWSETLLIDGTVETGEVDWEWVTIIAEVGGDPDYNYTDWVATPGAWSCPPGYSFVGIHAEDKDVGHVTIAQVDTDVDGDIDQLDVTITDAYPYYLCNITTHVHNNGTVPIHIGTPIITQDSGILVQFMDSIGLQLHPCLSFEMSFYVGVEQSAVPGSTYQFSISLPAYQWNEYP